MPIHQNQIKHLVRIQQNYSSLIKDLSYIFILNQNNTQMDTKTTRRNFYKNKVFLAKKYDQEYTAQRFQDDLTYLLDKFIPNANLKQLTKFMEKKYNRIIKTYPKVEKALKKVLRDKINAIPAELRKVQVQKFLRIVKKEHADMNLIEIDQDTYNLVSQDHSPTVNLNKTYFFESTLVSVPIQVNIALNPNFCIPPQNGKYIMLQTFNGVMQQTVLASTASIDKQKIQFNKGNLERQINNSLVKLNNFMQKLNILEASQEL